MPGADWRVDPAALRESGWRALFRPELSEPLALVVEIGFGRGEFLLELAEKEPETAFLGVELSFKRHLKMARRLGLTPLRNVRLARVRAETLVADLPAGCVSRFWINYPDPWPKKRHHGRRLIRPGFVSQLADRLAPGGRVDVATDHEAYAEVIAEVLAAEPALENLYAPQPYLREVCGRTPTAYELEWRAEGRPLHYFAYARRR